MTRQEVILKAYAKKLTWIQAAEILGCSAKQLQQLKFGYEHFGFHAVLHEEIGRANFGRVSFTVVQEVFKLYREEYFDADVRHFHEMLIEKHNCRISYAWTKFLLQSSGLLGNDNPVNKRL